MLFLHTSDMVLERSPYTEEPKTVTRRLVKPWDTPVFDDNERIIEVRNHGRVRYRVGSQYAVQPQYRHRGMGMIELLSIECEEAWRISPSSARAEGFADVHQFAAVFVKMHGKRALERSVWVLEFKLVSRVVSV
ncbi:MAG: hypothetical protein HC933_09705 [Pleurocapsa sp. SU_196_0]|nr:hypothetical protein [Pleurocapsa sp. SU_196_0]